MPKKWYHVNSLKMANFLDIAPKRKTPAARKVCVDKIGSRPRGILCVPKIRPGGGECAKPPATWLSELALGPAGVSAPKNYGNIASKSVKSTVVLFYWRTRAWHAELVLNGANDVRAARRPDPARRLPPPPSMHPHLPTLPRARYAR